jgi:hypothetical protein
MYCKGPHGWSSPADISTSLLVAGAIPPESEEPSNQPRSELNKAGGVHMSNPDYTQLVASQRSYFRWGATRPVKWRVDQLNALKAMVSAIAENPGAMVVRSDARNIAAVHKRGHCGQHRGSRGRARRGLEHRAECTLRD